MHFNIVTLFPELVDQALSFGVVGQSIKKEIFTTHTINPRDFAENKHKSVDDTAYGGGDGMIMTAPVLAKTMEELKKEQNPGRVIYMSPQGQVWNDKKAKNLSKEWQAVTLICGRYGGLDQRFIAQYVDEEISIGDFIMSGGEFAALSVLDSCVRHIDGVLGHPDSAKNESFGGEGLLEAPQFTKPDEVNGLAVPEVLLSGHHENIKNWRKRMSLLVTASKRPDLITKAHESDLKSAVKWGLELPEEELKVCGLSLKALELLKGE